MTDAEKIEAFAQSIYLAKSNKYFDDIDGEDGIIYIAQVIDWTNQLLDEIEVEADWYYARSNDYTIGTVSSTTQTFDLPDDVRKLAVNPDRPLLIQQDGSTVSEWDVVDSGSITRDNLSTRDKVTTVGDQIVFSRSLKDTEIGGTVIADVINLFPRLSSTNTEVLDFVKPKQLLILGVAKNSTLPDIVQGGISTSLVQKYNDLLTQAKLENSAASVSDEVQRDDLSYIGGVW